MEGGGSPGLAAIWRGVSCAGDGRVGKEAGPALTGGEGTFLLKWDALGTVDFLVRLATRPNRGVEAQRFRDPIRKLTGPRTPRVAPQRGGSCSAVEVGVLPTDAVPGAFSFFNKVPLPKQL
ncbi:hypothetical protein QYF61_010965 [Mycteria americana]|uniref:Uncharacterized protein n=1 Tax=Mycteria americana TaxID=33587 RepID=A0AAN7MP79_MYCAM|nr:hypothetical protein QYF61_010965 [Mycteria americana]